MPWDGEQSNHAAHNLFTTKAALLRLQPNMDRAEPGCGGVFTMIYGGASHARCGGSRNRLPTPSSTGTPHTDSVDRLPTAGNQSGHRLPSHPSPAARMVRANGGGLSSPCRRWGAGHRATFYKRKEEPPSFIRTPYFRRAKSGESFACHPTYPAARRRVKSNARRWEW